MHLLVLIWLYNIVRGSDRKLHPLCFKIDIYYIYFTGEYVVETDIQSHLDRALIVDPEF